MGRDNKVTQAQIDEMLKRRKAGETCEEIS